MSASFEDYTNQQEEIQKEVSQKGYIIGNVESIEESILKEYTDNPLFHEKIKVIIGLSFFFFFFDKNKSEYGI